MQPTDACARLLQLLIVWLQTASLGSAAVAMLLLNVLICLGGLGGGALLLRLFPSRRVALPPPPVQRRELAFVAATVVLNSVVTGAGLWLWRRGVIVFRTDCGLRAWLDVPLLLLMMDVAMYGLHRVAHLPLLYPLLHAEHHRYVHPRPLTLFVLHPLETLGFGGLWLVVLSLYSSSWLGMSVYLACNVVYGIIGHLGVEPMPPSVLQVPILRALSTSTFHAQHHQDPQHNFGFYLVLWDRLLGTLSPRYQRDFGRLP